MIEIYYGSDFSKIEPHVVFIKGHKKEISIVLEKDYSICDECKTIKFTDHFCRKLNKKQVLDLIHFLMKEYDFYD